MRPGRSWGGCETRQRERKAWIQPQAVRDTANAPPWASLPPRETGTLQIAPSRSPVLRQPRALCSSGNVSRWNEVPLQGPQHAVGMLTKQGTPLYGSRPEGREATVTPEALVPPHSREGAGAALRPRAVLCPPISVLSYETLHLCTLPVFAALQTLRDTVKRQMLQVLDPVGDPGDHGDLAAAARGRVRPGGAFRVRWTPSLSCVLHSHT